MKATVSESGDDLFQHVGFESHVTLLVGSQSIPRTKGGRLSLECRSQYRQGRCPDVVSFEGLLDNGRFPAAFPENWGDFRVTVNRELLLHLLNQGHHRLAFSTTSGPFIATGGIGLDSCADVAVFLNSVDT